MDTLFSIHGLIDLLVLTIYTGQPLRQVPFCLGGGKFLEVLLSRVSPPPPRPGVGFTDHEFVLYERWNNKVKVKVKVKANFLSLRSTEDGARSARNASAWTEAKSLEFVSDWLLVKSSNLPKSMT